MIIIHNDVNNEEFLCSKCYESAEVDCTTWQHTGIPFWTYGPAVVRITALLQYNNILST